MSGGLQILFLCSRNRRRSLTAEKVFDGAGGCVARSAGTERGARVRVTAGHIRGADVVVAMEARHLARVRRRFGRTLAGKRVVCLHIPDDHGFMDEGLVRLLRERLGGHWEAAE